MYASYFFNKSRIFIVVNFITTVSEKPKLVLTRIQNVPNKKVLTRGSGHEVNIGLSCK